MPGTPHFFCESSYGQFINLFISLIKDLKATMVMWVFPSCVRSSPYVEERIKQEVTVIVSFLTKTSFRFVFYTRALRQDLIFPLTGSEKSVVLLLLFLTQEWLRLQKKPNATETCFDLRVSLGISSESTKRTCRVVNHARYARADSVCSVRSVRVLKLRGALEEENMLM